MKLASFRGPLLTGPFAVFAMVALLLPGPVPSMAGDILRGGASPGNPAKRAAAATQSTAAAAAAARNNARDNLARTTRALQSVQAMQTAARAAAAAGASNNAGINPNAPGTNLPNVPNGLGAGGLEVDPGVAGGSSDWSGANAPTQSSGNGRTTVNIRQTQQTALLSWKTFNVGRQTTLRYDQSAGGSDANKWVAFNKVNDPSNAPSQILGSIEAPGQVYVINRNGIIFGGASQVNVGTLVASSLPINTNLIARGLLNNPDAQFLFSGIAIPAGAQGTPAFTPDPVNPAIGRYGDITVQPGAVISSPTNQAKSGGRVMLVGPNVTNAGTISTADGQTILAAGLQVGIGAHRSDDPSLRGLDVYVGSILDPNSASGEYAGTVTNRGLIDIPRANATLAGKQVRQLGAIESSTTVSFNGRIDVNASYDAVANTAFRPERTGDTPFLFRSTGQVELGAGSVMRILPEWNDPSKVAGTELPLRSQVNIRGKTVHFGADSSLLAPNANVTVDAGIWDLVQTTSSGTNRFVRNGGQIYLDRDALLSVAGTTDAAARLSDYILTVQLRGAELAGSPLQRDSVFRIPGQESPSITVDLRRTGEYNGTKWVGTPLADLVGYLGLIQRTVSELTTAGGTVNLNAGGSVVVQQGAKIDTSGGWVNYDGGLVKTSRVLYGGRLIDIADALPDRIYDGIYGQFTETHARWGVTKAYKVPFMTGVHYEEGYLSGASGGAIHVAAASVALDGIFRGNTVAGPRQWRSGSDASSSEWPKLSEFTLSLTSEEIVANASGVYAEVSPTPPQVILGNGSQAPADPFQLDSAKLPLPLRPDRMATLFLSPDLLTTQGFGRLTVKNPDGRVTIPKDVAIEAPALGSITLTGANVDILGSVTVPGGTFNATVFNISPAVAAENLRDPLAPTPPPNPGRGVFTLGKGATISTAGLLVDDRANSPDSYGLPIVTHGGQVSINAFSASLAKGSLVDVSGGVHLGPHGERSYGNGGSIVIKTGQDATLGDVIGGTLSLKGSLRGISGASGGSLSLQALLIQVGGRALHPSTFLLNPDFFNQGGFSNFSLSGLGLPSDVPGEFIPGLFIAPGTVIEPVTRSYVAVPHPPGGRGLRTKTVLYPEGMRSPVSLSFSSPGASGKEGRTVQGNIVMGQGSVIRVGPRGSVSLKGNTAAVLGSIYAPGGSIEIGGAGSSQSLLFPDTSQALTTVYIGPRSTLSTAGTTVLTPDPLGRRVGEVLQGGTISVSGNLVAAGGSVMDVSGASGVLDLHPTVKNPLRNYRVPVSSGLTSPLYNLVTNPARVNSDGGFIELKGGQMLFVDSTLRGFAGGRTAVGGTLSVSSGRFYEAGVIPPVLDTNLVVTQSGSTLRNPLPTDGSAIGRPVLGAGGTPQIARGYFAADSFVRGGFDSLALNGNVEFVGRVDVNARGWLRVADGGVIQADSTVNLTAPYVGLGRPFVPPVLPENLQNQIPFTNVAPTHGPGRLIVTADHIDIGTLTMQNTGRAVLNARGGDIRGNGFVSIAGDLTLRAGQIYPTTLTEFSVFAYDYSANGSTQPGSIRIEASGSRSLPLTGGGTLSLYASDIEQYGTLRAPFGVINVGWDGTGTPPVDRLTGNALPAPITTQLTLGSGSITSVSGVDPRTGKGILVPYGTSDGVTWTDPRGLDITGGGLPEKRVNLSAWNLAMQAGATVDLRGGGNLVAHQWLIGNGGQVDILGSNASDWLPNAEYRTGDLVTYRGETYSSRLNSEGITPSVGLFWSKVPQSYAIVPGYAFNHAPYLPANGYSDRSLGFGDRVFLAGGPGLKAGSYTLLPARYASLPGGMLVTPRPGMPLGTIPLAGGSRLVSGYRFNDLNQTRQVPTLASRFEVVPAKVFNQRAEYRQYFADQFLRESAGRLNTPVQRLPGDSAYLLFQATQSMHLNGSVLSPSLSKGRGSSIDIAGPLDFVISGGSTAGGPGVVALGASVLNGFGAGSLVIGGKRTRTAGGTALTVMAGNVTVDNPGVPLSSPDLTLAAQGNLSVGPGSVLQSSGPRPEAESYLVNGNGTLVRLSEDLGATVIRTGVTPGGSPTLTVGAGARLSGASLTLDSMSRTVLDPSAVLDAGVYALNSGRISLLLDNPGTLQPDPGLVLTGSLLDSLRSVNSLSLLSYTSIDFYGSGLLDGVENLALNAGGIRGFNQSGGTVEVVSNALRLGNSSGAAAPAVPAPATGDLLFRADTIQLGANQLSIDQFGSTGLSATSRIIGEGTGGLSVQGSLALTTPLLTGSAGSKRSVASGGDLYIIDSGIAPSGAGGLGASLDLTGRTVTISTTVALPSGTLSVRATQGDLTVNGTLDVGGTSRLFYDVTRYTDGGTVRLTADQGNVSLAAGSRVDVSAHPGGGNAGDLRVSASQGSFQAAGTLRGSGGPAGRDGRFSLDVAALPSIGGLSNLLSSASLTDRQVIRVRTGNVVVDGLAQVNDFRLSADLGGITVTGTIDASGPVGGAISLASRDDLVLAPGSRLTVAGQNFNSAGQGGSVWLESGTQWNGVVGSGRVDIQAGSTIDLSVASKVAGDALTPGSSAYQGQFSGKLHLRAPLNSSSDDVLVNPINGSIIDPSSVLVEGYRLYDLTSTGGVISGAVRSAVFADAEAFLGAAGTTTANFTNMTNRLLAGNPGLADVLVLAPGAEIISSGNLSLGAANSTTSEDWDLAGFRFGAKGAPGVLTLRAGGDITLFNAVSDGFTVRALPSSPTALDIATRLWLADLSPQAALLPVNSQSWSYRFTAGADLGAADFRQVLPEDALGAGLGSLRLGKDGGTMVTTGGVNALTANLIGATTPGGGRGLFQVIRTGSGDIDINAGRSVQLLNQFATIYTAGTRVADATLGGTFDDFSLTQFGGTIVLGAAQQNYPAYFSMAGGDVRITVAANIERLGSSSSRQLPNNWLYRRGYVNPATGQFGKSGFGTSIASTAWWVDFSNFFEGVGALGGGNVSLVAGQDVANVDGLIPTNARTSKGTPGNPLAANQAVTELGGGNLEVIAGNDLNAGVYYVERGHGTLRAGGQITTNSTRSPGFINVGTGANAVIDANSWLPTTLFLGKGGFDVSANGNVLLGPLGNPFLLPVGLGNSFWNKTYFSTYAPDSRVQVSSLGGDVTLRQGGYVNNVFLPLLEAWSQNQQLNTNAQSSSRSQPWLRLAETQVAPFRTVLSLNPPSIQATAHSGDIHLVGNLNLAPSPAGSIDLLANGAINGLQPTGFNSGLGRTTWMSSRINVSDADPAALAGIRSPFAYQNVVGTTQNQAIQTRSEFLLSTDLLFRESGGTIGAQASTQLQQALHAPGLLHRDDPEPVRIYAGSGDITGFTLFSPKHSRILAGRDLTDVALYLQNLTPSDISVVASGRDIIPYNPNSPLRIASRAGSNLVIESYPGAGTGPTAGDIQIGGPGTLQVLAGRNLDLGVGPNNADGTGAGITSIGKARNPFLPFGGADLFVGAGLGLSISLDDSRPNFERFIRDFVKTRDGQAHLRELGIRNFDSLSEEEKAQAAMEVFYLVLRDAGRDFNNEDSPDFGTYDNGFAAIRSLFGGGRYQGDIFTRERDIRTRSTGDISIVAPGGELTLAKRISRESLIPPGIITEAGGNINIFTRDDVNLGVSRIFTLRGGDVVIWSSEGDIAAGASSKTVQSAPPTRVLIDPSSATVTTDLAGLATGGGIGVLATVAGVRPGSVDLIAPVGVVDAGDAGISATGDLNIAASAVLNASNISVGGASVGTPPAVTAAAPNIGGLTSASASAGAAASAATAAQATDQAGDRTVDLTEETPSIITVEVLGYGGGAVTEEEEEEQAE